MTSRLLFAIALLSSFAVAQSSNGTVWSTKKNTWTLLTAPQRAEVTQFAEDYKSYLRVAKTAGLSTRETIRLAKAAGFVDFTDAAQVKPGARLILNNRDRAVAFVVVGTEPIVKGSRVVGTHHDSPHIDLKPRPIFPEDKSGIALFKTIYYGGIKKYQWSNLPLGLVGRIDTPDGRTVDVNIGFKPNDPVFVIPDNAPHSDTELRQRTYTNVLAGEELDPVAGDDPAAEASVAAEVAHLLTTTYNVREEDLVSSELALVPAAQPADVGLDRSLVGAYGQDDKLSSYCAARSLFDTKGTPRFTAIAYLTNFEEVGSVNNTGAASEFLKVAYTRLIAAQQTNNYKYLDILTALHNAQVISADTNDGVNPLFTSQSSEVSNAARLGWGVAIKKYGRGFDATSEFTAHIVGIFDKNQIPWQTQTPKVDVGGGGTIGGFMSQADMEVIDLGIPLLSMHAPFEMSSKIDLWNFYRFMKAFYGS